MSSPAPAAARETILDLCRKFAGNQLNAGLYAAYWQSMDTLREKRLLEDPWNPGRAPWKAWS